MRDASLRTRAETVVSAFPPLNRTLKVLWCRAERSSAGPMERSTVTVLGTIQIMVGVFNIGLGAGRTSTGPGDLTSLGAAYWLGALFIVTGIMTILAGHCPSSCLLGFTVFMNIAGALFAITAIVLYVIDLENVPLVWVCDSSRNSVLRREDSCGRMALFVQHLLASMDRTLIILALIQLYANIRFSVMGIGTLTREMEDTEAICCNSPVCRLLLEESASTTTILTLGAVQIMVGLFNIGLADTHTNHATSSLASVGVGIWLGALFLVAGILSVSASRIPVFCLVGFAVFVNIVVSIFDIVGIVLYAIHLGTVNMSWRCHSLEGNYSCYYLAAVARNLLTAADISLIIMAVLQLCVGITVAALSITALSITALLKKPAEHFGEDVDVLEPLLVKDIDPDV
ncbi:uncharacterized protein LOC142899582 [Nelusetta ayraudi]|uniref:uncharacterized protein LOC142899582 n=1 Tax=Nelusetta ayraudi TaxID=303726 RepID=UPI003F70315F